MGAFSDRTFSHWNRETIGYFLIANWDAANSAMDVNPDVEDTTPVTLFPFNDTTPSILKLYGTSSSNDTYLLDTADTDASGWLAGVNNANNTAALSDCLLIGLFFPLIFLTETSEFKPTIKVSP